MVYRCVRSESYGMKNSIEKQPNEIHSKRKAFYIFLAILVVAALGVSCVLAWQLKFKSDYRGVMEITDEQTFVEALLNSSEIKQPREYKLMNDISVHVDAISGYDFNFYGKLDGAKESGEEGGRYTVTFIAAESGSDGEEGFAKPLFNKIMAGAEISNIQFVASGGVAVGGDASRESTALLALENNGSVSGCSITVPEIVIGSEETFASGMVIKNFGSITGTDLTVNSVRESGTIEKSQWKCYFGGIAAVNYGQISDAEISLNFENLEVLHISGSSDEGAGSAPVIDRWFDNCWIGFVCGINYRSLDGDGKEVINIADITLISPGEYWQIAADHDLYRPDGTEKEQ